MSLDQLPDEIIQHLLHYVSPDDTLASFQLVSRRFARVSDEPLIWKYYCVNTFRYWHPEHDFRTKVRLPAFKVGWKRLFVLRRRRHAYVSGLFEGILASKVGRHRRFAQIGELGYDAKDFLLDQCNADDSVEDVLARRYFGQAVLDSIHRSIGIEQWHALVDPTRPDPALEKVLGAFDMFVLNGGPGDIDDICSILDQEASEFRASHPELDSLTPRQKALALNRWVRAQNLTGLKDPEKDYRNLRNCLIGQALRHPDHESIPIVSSAIFCCMAHRIGLDAACCNFPGHIHVVVSPAPNQTLDGEPLLDKRVPDRMYLDPFGNDDEVPLEKLEYLLLRFGGSHQPDAALGPARPLSIVNRTGSNMSATYVAAVEQHQSLPDLTRLLNGLGSMNLSACLYASMWAALVLTSPDTWAELDFFLGRFSRSWPEDTWLVEKYLVPRAPHRRIAFGRHAGQTEDAWKVLRTLQHNDELPPPVFRRSDVGNAGVPFKIGEVFRHTRYGYLGAITGWTDQGTRNLTQRRSQVGDQPRREEASDADAVHRLRFGNKTYFMYIRADSPERFVVAEENVEIVNDPRLVEADLFLYAGKYFKRFDSATCTFVSNNREQYPDD